MVVVVVNIVLNIGLNINFNVGAVGLCDQMNANALFCTYCDFVLLLFQTTALILLPINTDFSMVAV